MRLIDRFLEETRQELQFLADLRAEKADKASLVSGQDEETALAAVEKSIAERKALIEKLPFYSIA